MAVTVDPGKSRARGGGHAAAYYCGGWLRSQRLAAQHQCEQHECDADCPEREAGSRKPDCHERPRRAAFYAGAGSRTSSVLNGKAIVLWAMGLDASSHAAQDQHSRRDTETQRSTP